jgi:hypothetical protein
VVNHKGHEHRQDLNDDELCLHLELLEDLAGCRSNPMLPGPALAA